MMQLLRPQLARPGVCACLPLLTLLLSANLRAQAPPTPPHSEQEQKPAPSQEKPAPPTPETLETPKPAPAPAKPLSRNQRAWQILREGLTEKSAEKREKATHALGLLTRNAEAEKAAVQALKDEKPEVRLA